MGKKKPPIDSSPSAESSSSSDVIFDEISTIVKDVTAKVIETEVKQQVDLYVSSAEFSQGLKESINFDGHEISDAVKNVSLDANALMNEHNKLAVQIDDLEQYTRRTNIRIYGIPESTDASEDIDALSTNFFSNELGIDLTPADISRSHRVGKRGTKPRPIIVRLTKHNTKVQILRKRRQLKINKRPHNIQEDLTLPRREILRSLKNIEEGIINKVWTADGVIFFLPSSHTSTIERCTTMTDCKNIIAKYRWVLLTFCL